MKLYGNEENFRIKKVLIAAKLANKNVKPVSDIPPANVFPIGLSPALEDGKVNLFGAEAISHHIVGNHSPYVPEDPEYQQWIQWAEGHLLPNVLSYVLPSASVAKIDPKNLETARSELLHQLSKLNDVLLHKTFLVGERFSLADVSVALDLLPAYQLVLGDDARKAIANVNRWFQTVINQPGVKEVVGEFKFIREPAKFNEKEYSKIAQANAAPSSAAAASKKEKDQSAKKEKEPQQPKLDKKKKAKEAEPEEEMDAAEEAMAAQPKFSDPLAAMPAGTFNMDAFKRVYSNEDTATKAIPYFWENYDPEHYSIWYSEYKFPEELKLTYMSCNLIGGMFQRLEKMKKTAFASVCLFGGDNNSTISGIWIWRGEQLAFELCPDWQVDYESYNWKKLDPKDGGTKKMVNEYLLWEGDFGGKKFNQGKIFK